MPHIFPPTRRQLGHDVAVIVSQACRLPLSTDYVHHRRGFPWPSFCLPSRLNSRIILSAGRSSILNRGCPVCDCRQPFIPIPLARHVAVCCQSCAAASSLQLETSSCLPEDSRSPVSVLYLHPQVFSKVIKHGFPVATDCRRPSSQTC